MKKSVWHFINHTHFPFSDEMSWQRVLGVTVLSPESILLNGRDEWRDANSHLSWYHDEKTGVFHGWKPGNTKTNKDAVHPEIDCPVFKIESADGINWQTVKQGRVVMNVFLDKDEPDASRRFKCIYHGLAILRSNGSIEISMDEDEFALALGDSRIDRIKVGMFSAVSADGLNWRDHRPIVIDSYGHEKHVLRNRLLGGNADIDPNRHNIRFWRVGESGWGGGDNFPCMLRKSDGTYVAFYRTNIQRDDCLHPNAKRRERAVGRSECQIFGEWSPHYLTLRSDVNYLQGMGRDSYDFYQIQAWEEDGIYFCLVSVFYWKPDRVQLELAWSPDTIHWERIAPGNPVVPLDETPGNPMFGGIYAAMAPQVVDKKLLLYLGVNSGLHNAEASGIGRIRLASMDPGRIAGLQPTAKKDRDIISQPFDRCEDIEIDADISKGSVAIALCDADGNIQQGFGFTDMDPLETFSGKGCVRWKGLSTSAACEEKLRLRLRVQEQPVLYRIIFH